MRAGADGAPPETALYCWGAGAQRYAQIAAVLDDGAPAPRAPAAALFAVSRRSAVAAGGDHLASEPAPPEGARADAALRRGAVITVGAAEDHVFAATRHRILAWHKDAYQSDTLKWLRGAIVLQIACGDAFALARTDHLEVFAWGTWRGIRSNSLLEPGGARRVDGLVGVAVSCVAAGPAHAVAVSRGGGAFSWGGNEALQCGTRRTENFLWRPTAVCRSALVAGETFAASGASCGARHTLLPTTRGRVVACGDNGAKQCGGAGAVVHPPAAVDGVDDAVATAGGDEHSAVVRRDGSVVELRSGAHAAPHALVFGPGRCFATGVAAAGEVTFVLAAPTGGGAEVHEADDFELCLEVGDFDCLVRLRRVFESPSALAAAFMAPGGRPRGDLDGDDDAASLLSDSGSDVGSGSGADSDAAPAAVAAAGARSGGGAPAALLFEPREPWGLDGAAAGGARLAAPRSARSAALYVTAAARREAYFDARAVEDPGPRLVTQQAAILASIVRANVGARAVAERAARQQGNGPARPSEGQAERAAAAARTAAADGRRRRAAARARLRIEWDAASGDGPPPLVDFDGDSADDASMDADSMPELEETTDGGLDDSMPDLEELDDDLPDLEEDAPEARDAREARDHAPTEATPLVAPLRFTWPTLSSSASASSAETAQLAAAETVLGRSRSFDESIDDSMDEDVDEDCEFDDDDDEEDCYGDFDEDPRFIPEASSSSSSSEGDEEAAAAPAPRGAVPEDRLTDVLLGAAASAASGIEASLRAAAAAALGPVRSAVWPSFGFGLGAAPDAAAAAAGDDFDAVDLHAVELGRRRRGGGAVSRSFADVDDDADSSDDGSMPGLSPSSTTSERSRGSVAGLDPASPGGETAGRVGYSSGSSDRFGESAGAGVGYSSRRAVAARRHAGALPQLDSLESFSQGDLLVAGFEDDGDSPRAFDEDEDSLPALASASSTSSGEDDDEDDDDDDTEYEDDDDGNDEAFSLRFAVAPGGVDVRFARTRAPAGDAAGGGAALARPRARLRGRQARWKALRRLDCGRLEAVLLKIEGAKGTPWGCAAIKVLAAACRTCAGALETHATVNAAEWDEDVARCLVVLWASATLCDGTHVAPLLARHANAVEALVADAPPFAGAALGAGRGRTAVARIWRRSSVARCLSFAVGDCSSLRRRLREALAPLVYDAVEAASRDRVLPCGDGVDALQHAPRAAAHHHHRAGPDARAHAALTQRLVTLAHDAQRPGPAARVAAAAAGRRRASGSEALAVGYSAAAALELLHTVARCCGAGRDELDSFCLDCFDHLSGAAPRSKRLPPRDRFVWPEPEDDSDDDAPARPGGAPKGETAAAAPIDNSPEAASAAAAAVAHAYDAAAAQRLWPLRLTGVRPGGEAHSRVVSATSFDEEDAFGDAFVDGVQYRDTVDDAVFAGRGPARSALSLDFARWRAAGAPSGHLLGPDRWYFSAFACLLPRSARRLLVSVDERDRNWLGRARSGAGAAATRIPPFVSLLSASDFRIAGAARPAAARRPTHVAGRARGAGDAIAEDMFAAAAAAFAAAAFGADDSDDDALDDDAPDDDAPGDDAPGDDAEAPGDAAPSDDAALDDVRDWPAPALALASAGDLAPASYHHLLTAPRLSGRGHVEIDVAAASWPELLADLAPVRAAAPPPPPDVPPEAPPGAPRPLVLRHDAIVHRALLERRFGAAAETAVIEAATGFYLGAPLGEPAAAPVAAADGPAADGAGPTAADAVPRDVSADDASREVGGAAAAPVGAVPHLETLWAAPALRPADSARPAEVRPAASLELTLEEFLDEYTRRHQALLDDGAPAALPAAEAGAVPFAARRAAAEAGAVPFAARRAAAAAAPPRAAAQRRETRELLRDMVVMMTSEGGDADEWLADAGDERYFPLQCRRGETLLKDAMDAVRGASDDDLGRELRVAFAGEPGVDEGGVRREFLELVAAKTFDEAHFDAVESSRLWFANADGAKLKTVQGLGSTPAEFVRFAGTLCGLALTHGHTLQSCRLPTVAYAAILAARPADVDARARGAREAVPARVAVPDLRVDMSLPRVDMSPPRVDVPSMTRVGVPLLLDAVSDTLLARVVATDARPAATIAAAHVEPDAVAPHEAPLRDGEATPTEAPPAARDGASFEAAIVLDDVIRGALAEVALPTLLEYLAELDGGLAYGLRQLVDFEPPSAVEETFLYAFEWDGSELFPGGASVAVTALNRRRFARLVSLRLLGARNALLRDFAAGFWRTGARASTLHHLLGPADLRDALEGRDAALDWAELRPQARYDGWGAEPELHPVISAFWATLAALDEAESKNLLKFVTGSAAAPIGGLAALRPPQHAPFRIQRNGADSDHLPTTHVCFHTLLLPDYDPPTKLQRLLKRAIHECEGFGLR